MWHSIPGAYQGDGSPGTSVPGAWNPRFMDRTDLIKWMQEYLHLLHQGEESC